MREHIFHRHFSFVSVLEFRQQVFKGVYRFEITFGEGISKIGEIVDLGVQYNIIQKSGSWFSYNGTKLAQGRDATKTMLKDNPELAEEIEGLIKQAIVDQAQ